MHGDRHPALRHFDRLDEESARRILRVGAAEELAKVGHAVVVGVVVGVGGIGRVQLVRQFPCVVHAVGVAVTGLGAGVGPAGGRRGGEPVARLVAEPIRHLALQRKPGAVGVAWPRFAVVVRDSLHRQVRDEPGVLLAEALCVVGPEQPHGLAAVGQTPGKRPDDRHTAWHPVMRAEPRCHRRLGGGIEPDEQQVAAGRDGRVSREI